MTKQYRVRDIIWKYVKNDDKYIYAPDPDHCYFLDESVLIDMGAVPVDSVSDNKQSTGNPSPKPIEGIDDIKMPFKCFSLDGNAIGLTNLANAIVYAVDKLTQTTLNTTAIKNMRKDI